MIRSAGIYWMMAWGHFWRLFERLWMWRDILGAFWLNVCGNQNLNEGFCEGIELGQEKIAKREGLREEKNFSMKNLAPNWAKTVWKALS